MEIANPNGNSAKEKRKEELKAKRLLKKQEEISCPNCALTITRGEKRRHMTSKFCVPNPNTNRIIEETLELIPRDPVNRIPLRVMWVYFTSTFECFFDVNQTERPFKKDFMEFLRANYTILDDEVIGFSFNFDSDPRFHELEETLMAEPVVVL